MLVVAVVGAWVFWTPGLEIKDGRHDRGQNGIWLQHGWLGADEWFVRNEKTNLMGKFRGVSEIQMLAETLRFHGIRDVFPHVSPAQPDGTVSPIDDAQTERFLDAFSGFRVIPWTGGVNGRHVSLRDVSWHARFAGSIRAMIDRHPRLAGVQLNVEPLTSGDTNFLALLTAVRGALPHGKVLSIAAYPPPTVWHAYPEVHWDRDYFTAVAERCDQLAVMMYDTALRDPRLYQHLMSQWTREVLEWSNGRQVLLGIPTYDDEGVQYHFAATENLTNGLLGIHRGLSSYKTLPDSYQGLALYCEWEMDDGEWVRLREHFLKR